MPCIRSDVHTAVIVVVRHEERRVRVLLAYTPVEFKEIPQVGEIPVAFTLQDIVIVREKLNSRPLKEEHKEDILWCPVEGDVSSLAVTGQRRRCLVDGRVDSVELPQQLLQKPSQEGLYQRVFPGGIVVEADEAVAVGALGRVRVTWMPSATVAVPPVFAAEIAFSVKDEVGTTPRGEAFIAPPLLADFFVDTLQ